MQCILEVIQSSSYKILNNAEYIEFNKAKQITKCEKKKIFARKKKISLPPNMTTQSKDFPFAACCFKDSRRRLSNLPSTTRSPDCPFTTIYIF